jgi:hypothetical protein
MVAVAKQDFGIIEVFGIRDDYGNLIARVYPNSKLEEYGRVYEVLRSSIDNKRISYENGITSCYYLNHFACENGIFNLEDNFGSII